MDANTNNSKERRADKQDTPAAPADPTSGVAGLGRCGEMIVGKLPAAPKAKETA
jgi:hypothetical protein